MCFPLPSCGVPKVQDDEASHPWRLRRGEILRPDSILGMPTPGQEYS